MEDESLNRNFIVQKFSCGKDNEDINEVIKDSDNTIVSDLMGSLNELSQENKKIKDKADKKIAGGK